MIASSFLWMKIVQAFFHSAGTDPDSQTIKRKSSVRWVLIVREEEVILPTFSRDKSILLLNCPLDA